MIFNVEFYHNGKLVFSTQVLATEDGELTSGLAGAIHDLRVATGLLVRNAGVQMKVYH